jgi:hypothetical protein
MSVQPRIEYVDARRVLLDALTALHDQIGAVILVGAQAVYLRTAGRLPTYQPFTTDADLVLDPARLADRPPLAEVMLAAGFILPGEPGMWEARFHRPGIADEIVVPVDLIVPMQVAVGSGRRGARLGGDHGKHTARKSAGLEGTLVDNSAIQITSLETTDRRSVVVNVAGEAALLVSKLFKLGERLEKPERLEAKDAGDVYRLFDVLAPDEMADRLDQLLTDDRSATTTMAAIEYGNRLFRTPASPGVRLGVAALAGTMPEPTVVAVLTSYWNELESIVPR